MGCLAFAAWTLWLLGYPDQALTRSQEALALAHERAHPLSLAIALQWAAILHQFRREGQAAQERAEALIALATQQGFAQQLATGAILRGSALAMQGQAAEGILQMRQGLDAYRATGAEVGRLHYLAVLSEAYGTVGRAAEGLTVLGEALEILHQRGNRWLEAELHRLKGELLLKQKAKGARQRATVEAEAEACFRQALDVADGQGAKSIELRAAMSLSRLWQRQGKRDEAHQLLGEIYGWFTEGFDTPDLQEARALLEELGSGKAKQTGRRKRRNRRDNPCS